MENKNQSSLIILVVLLAVIFVGLLTYYFYNKSGNKSMDTAQDNPSLMQTTDDNTEQRAQKGDLDYQEPQTKIEIGTQGVSKGNFDRIEGESIFFKTEQNTLTQYPLTTDEIAVSCTSQDLTDATELDFNLVKEVKIATPATLASMIPQNEYIVVFAQDVQGVNRVHTVAMAESKCTKK